MITYFITYTYIFLSYIYQLLTLLNLYVDIFHPIQKPDSKVTEDFVTSRCNMTVQGFSWQNFMAASWIWLLSDISSIGIFLCLLAFFLLFMGGELKVTCVDGKSNHLNTDSLTFLFYCLTDKIIINHKGLKE